MEKAEAERRATNLVTELVRSGRGFISQANQAKQNGKDQADYFAEFHKTLMAYFESLQT